MEKLFPVSDNLRHAFIVGSVNLFGSTAYQEITHLHDQRYMPITYGINTALCGALAGLLLPDKKWKIPVAAALGTILGVALTSDIPSIDSPQPASPPAGVMIKDTTHASTSVHSFNSWQELAAASRAASRVRG